MIKNYLKIAYRSLMKRKGYSFINVVGLAIGMAVCLLIVLFIKSETGFDKFHKEGDNIYRLVVERKYPGRSTSYSNIPQSYAQAIKQEMPEVREAVRIFDFGAGAGFQLKYGDKKFEEKNALFADSNFFNVFQADILAGNKEHALNKPNSIVITERAAVKYFGSVENAIGKSLQPEGDNPPVEVTAVCSNWPESSHFGFDMLISTAGNQNFHNINYVNFGPHTYVLLNKNASVAAFEAKMPKVIEKYAAGNIERQFGVSFKKFQEAGNGYKYYLQPLTKIHLTSHLEGELKPNGSLTAVYIFSLVAVFILLIACVNFINLSTARSGERAKEVGVRKTFGSEKKALVSQFLAESALLSFTAMLIAIGLAYLLLPLFNQISGKDLSFSGVINANSLLILLGITLLTGILGGLYPAFVLSSFKPIQVLRGKFKTGSYGLALRNGLVVFQFAVSVILIICTIVVNQQMNYMTSDKLGFNKEHTIVLQRTDLLAENTRAFKNEVRKIAGVENVSGATAVPGLENYFGISWQEMSSTEPMTGRGIMTDDQYQSVLGLQLTEGRFFSKDFPTDTLAVVLNEKAVKEMGLIKPIGARVITPEQFLNAPDGSQRIYTVVGVVKDFHYQSLHQPIVPLVFTNAARFNDVMFLTAVRVKTDNFKETVAAIEQKWKTFIKDRPFQYEFLDKTIAAQYHAEQRTQKIFIFFSSLTIFIACIGLLGLAAYTTQQRVHEIGIRKVLGASVGSITTMLSKHFLKLVLIAMLLSVPVAWWMMNKWLEDFTYRINISWWVFALSGALAFGIALLTVSFQAIKAAIANPVKSLRTE
jgi:putative ABC transport system permease protein